MEEENFPHSVENIDFQMQGDRLDELTYDNDSSDTDESNEFVDEENDDGNDQVNVDFLMQGQDYFAVRRYHYEHNDTEINDHIHHSSSPYNSSNLAVGILECNDIYEFGLEMVKEIWDFLMFYQTLFSPQVEGSVILRNKYFTYDLPNTLRS